MKLEDLKNNQLWILEEGFYQGRLKSIKKSPDKLQPIYEGFINALEAIVLSKKQETTIKNYYIVIRIYLTKSTVEKKLNFQHIEFEDNGIGFNNENFNRFFILDDNRKLPNNKGTGRVQYLRYFNKADFQSIYVDKSSSSGYKLRTFSFSEKFLSKRALINHIETKNIEATDTKTVLKLTNILNQKSDFNFYSSLTVEELKEKILDHYLLYFCDNKNELPEIKLEEYHDNVLQLNKLLFIKNEDILDFHDNWAIDVSYSKMSDDRKIVKDEKEPEKFQIKSFVIPKERLKFNDLLITCKGRKIETKIKLETLHKDEEINGNRYLFLISGNYLDEREDDPRGEIIIYSRDDYKKLYNAPQIYPEEPEILLDDFKKKLIHQLKQDMMFSKKRLKKRKINCKN
jgi:hypothetical protein